MFYNLNKIKEIKHHIFKRPDKNLMSKTEMFKVGKSLKKKVFSEDLVLFFISIDLHIHKFIYISWYI